MNWRPLRAVVVVPTLLMLAVGCGSQAQGGASPGAPAPKKLMAVASFYPLQYFAERVGGERVAVFNPVPPGAEPHDLELSPRSLQRITQSKVFLYLGEGFQPAVDRALATIRDASLVTADAGAGVDFLAASAEEEGAQAAGSAGARGAGAAKDPHIWLDPTRAQTMVRNVVGALVQADPAGKNSYTAGGEQLIAELGALDSEYRARLKDCKRKDLVTTHAAFAYLAQRYGLKQVPITGLSPETEPAPGRLQSVISFVRDNNIKYIFFETLVEPRVARLVATETGAQTLVLNPLEGLTAEQAAQGKDYMGIMRDNLTGLTTGLECAR